MSVGMQVAEQRRVWMPIAFSLAGEAGQTLDVSARPPCHFRGGEFFATDTSPRPGSGTVIEAIFVCNRQQVMVPIPTWVFGEWAPPEERPWRMHAAKLLGTPLETEAVRQEAARLGLASAAEKMTWTTAPAHADIRCRVRFLERCTWQAVLWGWGLM